MSEVILGADEILSGDTMLDLMLEDATVAADNYDALVTSHEALRAERDALRDEFLTCERLLDAANERADMNYGYLDDPLAMGLRHRAEAAERDAEAAERLVAAFVEAWDMHELSGRSVALSVAITNARAALGVPVVPQEAES